MLIHQHPVMWIGRFGIQPHLRIISSLFLATPSLTVLTCSKRAGEAATPRARRYGQRGSE